MEVLRSKAASRRFRGTKAEIHMRVPTVHLQMVNRNLLLAIWDMLYL